MFRYLGQYETTRLSDDLTARREKVARITGKEFADFIASGILIGHVAVGKSMVMTGT